MLPHVHCGSYRSVVAHLARSVSAGRLSAGWYVIAEFGTGTLVPLSAERVYCGQVEGRVRVVRCRDAAVGEAPWGGK